MGDRVLLRHGSVEYAALLKKHGFPPLRLFSVLEVIPEFNQPDLTQGEPNAFLVNQILDGCDAYSE
eukprot:1103336-Pleurochrysis_carterae.AAC.1